MQKEPRKVAVSFGVDLVEIELKIKNLHKHFALEYSRYLKRIKSVADSP